MVKMVSKDRILPLTEDTLIEAGIKVSGHRKRILVQLELAAGNFESNQELVGFVVNYARQMNDL
jgi:hypothetical protein